MSTPPSSPETPTWSLVGEFLAATATVIGACYVAAVTVLRPLFENLVMRAIRSKRPELGDFLRSEVLKGDLDATDATAQKVERLVLVAESNAEMVRELAGRHDILDRELRALPALAQSLEACTAAVGLLSRDMGQLSGKIERYAGMFEQLQRDRV